MKLYTLSSVREADLAYFRETAIAFRVHVEHRLFEIKRGEHILVEVAVRQFDEAFQDNDPDSVVSFFPALHEADEADPLAADRSECLCVEGQRPLLALSGMHVEGRALQRLGQLLRAVEDSNHINAIWRDTIDQAVGVGDQFTEVSILVHRHDAPGVRVID